MRARTSLILVLALSAATVYAAVKHFEVKPDEFDPGRTHLVQGAWLAGIGCPTEATTAAGQGEEGPAYTDPACATADTGDKKVEGLLLAKTGPTSNVASAFARIENVNGVLVGKGPTDSD